MKDMNSYFEGSSVEFQKWWDEKDHSRDKELTPYSHSGVGWEAGYNAAIKELENPQIATVIDPDTGFTINGPEWLQLPLKARLIIQELSLQNDALKAEKDHWEMLQQEGGDA